jgi:hypothetical protein
MVQVDQMAQLTDRHIIGDGMGCLDDVPIKCHIPLLIAGSPTRLEVTGAHPCWRHPDLIGITILFLLQALQGGGAIPVMKVLLDGSLLAVAHPARWGGWWPGGIQPKIYPQPMPLRNFEPVVAGQVIK